MWNFCPFFHAHCSLTSLTLLLHYQFEFKDVSLSAAVESNVKMRKNAPCHALGKDAQADVQHDAGDEYHQCSRLGPCDAYSLNGMYEDASYECVQPENKERCIGEAAYRCHKPAVTLDVAVGRCKHKEDERYAKGNEKRCN